MARCRIQNCKIKLTKKNLHTIVGYSREEIETNDPTKVTKPVKIKLCQDCARMYIGKFYNSADDKFFTFLDEIEFQKELEADLLEKIKIK